MSSHLTSDPHSIFVLEKLINSPLYLRVWHYNSNKLSERHVGPMGSLGCVLATKRVN